MVATVGVLELQVTEFVRYKVEPFDVVPIAMNCVVWPAVATVCAVGMIASETTAPVPPLPVPPPVPPADPTVIESSELTGPLKPCAVAVTVLVPDPTPVTTPFASTVATDGVFD